ncbi:MAG: PhnD/SsuA/transferrin family substrate-binding protein, partial [Clostridia bacterium]|nr:PhnD/SsuA/transferrin family substrate-binding protein [Clostridia bacterium]
MKTKKGSIGICLTVFAVVAFALIGCGSQGSSKGLKVNIGYFNNVTHGQALYMKQEGTLEKALNKGATSTEDEVSIRWNAFNAGPAEVEALFSGAIDIGFIGPVPAISANVKSKGDVTVIAGASNAGAELVKSAGSAIESVKDLDGKTISIPQIGNTQHL